MLEFIQSRRFTARLGELPKDSAEEVLLEIESDLLKNPERGPIIQGTGGLRMTRAGNPQRGKGKRGGFRYMYYYVEKDGRIFLILIFSKDEQDDLTPKQKKWLKENWGGPMKTELFAELQESVREAAAYQRGDRTLRLKVSRFALPKRIAPSEIRKLRVKMHISQPVFARYLGASVASVRGWEQGSRKPRSMALRLLHIVKKNPAVLLDEYRG